MSTIHALMAQLALASDDTIPGGPVETVPASDLEATTAVADLQPEAAVTEQTLAVLDDMVSTSEGLETDAEILEATIAPAEGSTQEGPGAEPVAAGLAVESIARARRRFGIAQFDGFSGGYKPAQESFSRASARKPATKLLLLGIGDTLSKIWQKIKAFFKGLWERIKNGVTKIFQSNVKTAKRAEQLKTQVNDNNGTLKDQRIKNASIAKGFADGNKSPKFDDVKAILARHTLYLDGAKNANEKTREFVNAMNPLQADLNTLVKALASSGSGSTNVTSSPSKALMSATEAFDQKTDAFVKNVMNAYGGASTNLKVDDLRNSGVIMDNVDTSKSTLEAAGPFFGQRFLYVAALHKTGNSNQTHQDIQLQAGLMEITKGSAPSDAETMTKNEMLQTCDIVKKLCSEMNQYEFAVKVGNNVSDDLMKQLDATIAIAGKVNAAEDTSSTSTEAMRTVRNTLTSLRVKVQGIIRLLSTNNSSMPVYTMSAANTALDYVSASLKAHKA